LLTGLVALATGLLPFKDAVEHFLRILVIVKSLFAIAEVDLLMLSM